uniref:Uncharacterized protein n=1 Tax=Rhizophora mucronata TaxID=61149 RepID=A0A2P2NLK3_RHIMU
MVFFFFICTKITLKNSH